MTTSQQKCVIVKKSINYCWVSNYYSIFFGVFSNFLLWEIEIDKILDYFLTIQIDNWLNHNISYIKVYILLILSVYLKLFFM